MHRPPGIGTSTPRRRVSTCIWRRRRCSRARIAVGHGLPGGASGVCSSAARPAHWNRTNEWDRSKPPHDRGIDSDRRNQSVRGRGVGSGCNRWSRRTYLRLRWNWFGTSGWARGPLIKDAPSHEDLQSGAPQQPGSMEERPGRGKERHHLLLRDPSSAERKVGHTLPRPLLQLLQLG